MRYVHPNCKREWEEALRYRIFERLGYDFWIKVCKEGKSIRYSAISSNVGNIDLNFSKLEKAKIDRFYDAFDKGAIELPIVVRFSKTRYDLLGGNTRLAGLIMNRIDPYVWLIDLTKYDEEGQNQMSMDETDSGSSGAFEAPFGGKSAVMKRPITSIPNYVNEVTDSSVSAGAAFDVPFGGGGTKGRRDPLKIDGPKSIYKNRAVKDKKFPRFGGPDAVFVKIKEKCKKFPYCNQGNQGNLEFLHEDQEFKDAISKAAEMYGIPYSDVEKIVINEIKKIFI